MDSQSSSYAATHIFVVHIEKWRRIIKHSFRAFRRRFHPERLQYSSRLRSLLCLQISFLEVEVETLTEQLQPPDTCVPPELNGAVTVDDLDLLQKTNRDLEQQLADKNRVCSLTYPPMLPTM